MNEKQPNGPVLTDKQALQWEWTGEKPRKLEVGESGMRSHWFEADCCERDGILESFSGEITHSFYYWPLRRRQQEPIAQPPAEQVERCTKRHPLERIAESLELIEMHLAGIASMLRR